MKNILRLTACVAVFCFLPLHEARASVSSSAGIWYFESTNEDWGVATISVDYNDQLYYRFFIEMSLIAEGVGGSYDSEVCNTEYFCTYAQAEASLPHDPNAEYEVWSSHTAEVLDHYGSGSGYVDYYGYSDYYTYEDPLYYPMAYDFYGSGYPRNNIYSILLGNITGVASGGTMHGLPHHLKVVSDQTQTYNCGQGEPVRIWRFRVVDAQGRNAGRVPIRENFTNAPVYSSCDGTQVTPTTCSMWHSYANGFWDTVSPGGCLPDSCGYTIVWNEWRWCPQRRPQVVLTSMIYEVYTTGIKLNGSTQFSPGHELF